MAKTASKRRRAPRQPQPLPPPLPPEERSVGQLVAETIRFYQHHFFQTLPLGLSVAALTQLTVAFGHRRVEPYGHPPPKRVRQPTSLLGGGIEVTILLGALLLTASYIVAIVLVTGANGRRAGRCAIAYGLGVLVFLPVPLLAQLLVLPAVAYLALRRLGRAGRAGRRAGASADSFQRGRTGWRGSTSSTRSAGWRRS